MSVADVLALPQVSPAGWGARKDYDSWQRTGVHDGTVIHFTGTEGSQAAVINEHGRCDNAIRAIEDFHIDTRGWKGIGYNFCVCPHGTLFRLRGDSSGAHNPGDTDGDGWPDNLDAIGVLLLVGPGEQPAPASLQMLQRVCDTMAGDYVAPHSQSRSTNCPGDHLRKWITDYNSGTVTLPEEDDMPYSKEELTDIVQDAIFKAGFGRTNPETFGDRVAAIRVDARAARAEVAALRAVVERIAKGDTMTDDEIAQVVRDAAKNIDVNVTVTQP